MSETPNYKVANVSDLIPYARNSRTHSDEQVTKIASSIKEFGFLNPVIIDGENGIIAGHGRIMAAQKLGIETVPAIEASHLTDAQRRAYIIADNRLALDAGWDDEMLRVEFAELEEAGFDLGLTGFELDEIEALQIEELGEGLTDEDAVPDVADDPVSVLGDVWLLGKHRLMCGDSTSIDAAMILLQDKPADMVNTDPPYGISYQSNGRTKSAKFDVLKNDDVFLDIAPVIHSCSKGWVFVWTSWKVLREWLDQFESFGYPTNQVIWSKGGGAMGDLKGSFASDYETALV